MKYNKLLELEEKLKEFDFGEKFALYAYKAPDFFIELNRGSYNKSSRITVDDEEIVIELFEKNEITETKIVNDINIINKIKDIVHKKQKDIVNLGFKLTPQYLKDYGRDNSYGDSMLLKDGNIIVQIHNGSIGDKKAKKIMNAIYEVIG